MGRVGRGRVVAGLMALAVALAASFLLGSGPAAAHLFHQSWEPPENQLTKDTRTLQLLVDDPDGRFELAREVYEGRTRVRVRPGGFRRWLVRPMEPGMVFKADYQLERWSGSLRTEAERIDGQRSTRLHPRLDAALIRGDRDGIRAALREMYVVLVDEVIEALWQRLEDPETAARLYRYVQAYWSVNLEAYLNIHRPIDASVARAALDAMSRAIGDDETGAPAAPEVFDKQRRRFLRILKSAVPGA